MTAPNPARRTDPSSPAANGGSRPARRQADDPATGRALIDDLECEANAMTPPVDPARTERRQRRDGSGRS
jgi:hypothetical protein